jgi:Ca2+/Na+ antiporter
MARKNDHYDLGKIVLIVVLILAFAYIFYYFIKKAAETTPDKQGIYHTELNSLQNINVPVNKFGTVALTFVVWLVCGILFLVELIIGIINSLFLYPTFILFVTLSYKLAAIEKTQIKDLIK